MEFRYFFRNNSDAGLDYLHLKPHVSIPYISILSVSCLFGTIGNILVICSVCIVKHLRTTGNIFIVNLAIADLCVTAIVDPFAIIGIVRGEDWFSEKGLLCEFIASICLTSCFCSLLTIVAISVNRYAHICRHNIYSQVYTPKNTVCMCVVLWVISFLLELPNFVGWGDHVFDKKSHSCLWDRTADYSYTLFFCTVGVAVPIALISICYLKIFRYVRASKKRVNQLMQFNSNLVDKVGVKRVKESMKLARTLFAIFLAFAVCWTPVAICVLADFNDKWPVEPHLFAVLLAHSSSSINCILYGLTNAHFREGYSMLLTLAKLKQPGSQQRLTQEEETMKLTSVPIENKQLDDSTTVHLT